MLTQGLKTTFTKLFVCAAAVGTVVALWDGAADATTRCRNVNGRFDLLPVEGPACTSPVGVCGRGTFRGEVRGDYFSLLTSLVPSADTAQTGVVLITGDTVLEARMGHRTGDLFFKDSGAFSTVGDGEFAELFTIVGGTEEFDGATGTLFLIGTYDFAAGGVGTYEGRVCIP